MNWNTSYSLLVLLLLFFPLLASSSVEEQTYIVYFGEHKGDKALHEIEEHHLSYLINVKENKDIARDSLIYSYKHSINGFSALLTPDQASKLSELEEVASVFKSRSRQIQTTRSWNFLGLDEDEDEGRHVHYSTGGNDFGRDLLNKARYGQQIIVGMIDSGVWPESRSFSDEGMGPIPKKWKGICQTGFNFDSSHCNRKIIGARFFAKGFLKKYKKLNATEDFLSPCDADGHGTHTASTVGGRVVHNASALGGYASGTASGGAPLAHLAIYKACWAIPNSPKSNGNVCFDEDMLEAIDQAIEDGVDVLSMSIGYNVSQPFDEDAIAIGSLHAAKHDIVAVAAAGNMGPASSTVSNTAPWMITVGASSVDRDFQRSVVLGNGLEFKGYSIAPNEMRKMYPLVYAGNVALPGVPYNVSGACAANSLSPELVKGKIVFCMREGVVLRYDKGVEVKRAGGVGLILGNTKNISKLSSIGYDVHMLPATLILADDTEKILRYINTTKNPRAIIKSGKTVYQDETAPIMAAFTSKGPNLADLHILKPDITAPGVNILAAWSGASSPTKFNGDNRRVEFNFDSGTSMATPHVAAAAALLKAIHPRWSSAAIRSALITTAWMTNNKNEPIRNASGDVATPFEYGAGHFRPTKAADPGLVYDASYKDYITYLCSVRIKKMLKPLNCPKVVPTTSLNLNYPSIAVPNLKEDTVSIKRTVTNVGSGNSSSVYFFSAKPPEGVSISVKPSVLSFDAGGEKKSFVIKVKARRGMVSENKKGEYVFGWYSWTDGLHIVRSPLAVSFA